MDEVIPVDLATHDLAPDASPAQSEGVRRWMSDQATRLIAAICLCDADFPHATGMPRICPVPSNDLGHQVLFDYDRLVRILWGTAFDIQKAVKRNKWTILAPLLSLLVAGVFVVPGGFALSLASDPTWGLVLLAAGVVAGALTNAKLRPDVGKIAAEIRARNIRTLIDGGVPTSVGLFDGRIKGQRRFARWGDGNPEGDRCPVLVMVNDSVPFPGYGLHQARRLFVCRPNDEASPPQLSPSALNEAVSTSLIQMARNSGIPHISSGHVVLIDGRTLRKGSHWLGVDEDMRDQDPPPPLFLPRHRIDAVHRIDDGTSVRVYSCIQVVVPDYLMCVTFFVRTFLAGNSAACEVNVSTLGPPRFDWDHIRDRLRVHRREQDEDEDRLEDLKPLKSRVTGIGQNLKQVRQALKGEERTFRSRIRRSELFKIEPFDKEALAHEPRSSRRSPAVAIAGPGSTRRWRTGGNGTR